MNKQKRSIGVCYYPEHWKKSVWSSDARAMAKLGITWVRINEFAWSEIEPSPGNFQLEWLDEIIEILGKEQLKVILATPTATPPRWMLDKYPDMLGKDEHGIIRDFGSRRHYCFSHRGYAFECERIVELLAKRYGKNKTIFAWQTDNEYGCHDTTLSYSESAKIEFQNWLRGKFSLPDGSKDGDINALNEAWGNAFWSMKYGKFSEINLPHRTVTAANPAHLMAFRKFSSEQVIKFNRRQANIIKKYSACPITHNFMGKSLEFDHFKLGRDLDIASWDSYPLGFLEDRLEETNSYKKKYLRQGSPDFQAFHHDLYRSVGKGRWWVMEQQPGPVNWAPYNPAPLKGMLKLWVWEAFAHGAEVVSFFRWRQVPFGQEKMHAGLNLPDGKRSVAFNEVKEIFSELKTQPNVSVAKSKTAIIFDYDSAAAWTIDSYGKNLTYFELVFSFYKILRKFGQSVDIVSVDQNDFSNYKIIFVPGLMFMKNRLKRALSNFNGGVFIGPRSSIFDKNMNISVPLPPNLPGFSAEIVLTETFRSDSPIPLEKGGNFCNYREVMDGNAKVIEKTKSGEPAVVKGGNFIYILGWMDKLALNRLIKEALIRYDIKIFELHSGVRIREDSIARFWFNYSSETQNFYGKRLEPGGVYIEDL